MIHSLRNIKKESILFSECLSLKMIYVKFILLTLRRKRPELLQDYSNPI